MTLSSVSNWDNTALFTYVNSGYNSGKSGQVQMTAYTDRDAKWYFAPVSVIAGNDYTFSDHYKTDTTL